MKIGVNVHGPWTEFASASISHRRCPPGLRLRRRGAAEPGGDSRGHNGHGHNDPSFSSLEARTEGSHPAERRRMRAVRRPNEA